jgi:CHAT domain-containing protein
VEVSKIPINRELLHQIDIYTKALFDKNNSPVSFTKYVKSSNYLYQSLFEPVIEKTIKKSEKVSITIIADDGLALIPFEAFTTTMIDTSSVNYWGLPYLCKEYAINYAYSLNILHKNVSSQNSSKGSNKILAMSYSPMVMKQKDVESSRNNSELPYSALEINEISMAFNDVDFDAYEEATEAQFKSLAQNYAVIHLAIHGQADTINRYNSKLLFRSDPNNEQDGQLHDYELYTMDLSDNQLAVLSACETGLGKLLEGEGIFSIARGFAYAGSPAVVMSLWKVNDKSTSMLMKYFYENLSKGMPKDKALQLAKVAYIENSDEVSAHPSNWAAFIAMGNNSPIQIKSKNSFISTLALTLVGLFIIFAIAKYKKQY